MNGSRAKPYRQVLLAVTLGEHHGCVPDREFADHRVVGLRRVPVTPANLLRRSEIARKATTPWSTPWRGAPSVDESGHRIGARYSVVLLT